MFEYIIKVFVRGGVKFSRFQGFSCGTTPEHLTCFGGERASDLHMIPYPAREMVLHGTPKAIQLTAPACMSQNQKKIRRRYAQQESDGEKAGVFPFAFLA